MGRLRHFYLLPTTITDSKAQAGLRAVANCDCTRLASGHAAFPASRRTIAPESVESCEFATLAD